MAPLSTLRRWIGMPPRPAMNPRSSARFRPLLELLEDRQAPATLRVGADEQYQSIQAAVNAANANDTILIDPGTYTEQVTIGAGKDGLLLKGESQKAVIQAPAVMTAPEAIVLVSGSQNVTITNLTITGPGGGSNGSIEAGIRIDNGGSATITKNHITNIRDNPFGSSQEPVAIEVGRASEGQWGSAVISHNLIDNYQKGGIFADNVGTNVKINHNIIRGAGPTDVIVQNGIQISGGATGSVTHNTISANSFTDPNSTDAGTGILLFHSGTVSVAHNKTFDNDIGIFAVAAHGAFIHHNEAWGNSFNGIDLDSTNGARVSHNNTHDNGSENVGDGGIALYNSSNNVVEHNVSNNNQGDGIYVDATSTGNKLQHNRMKGNSIFDAEDESAGTGTGGTANTWLKNHCQTDNHDGALCDPDHKHHGKHGKKT